MGLAGECCSVLAAETHKGWEQDKLIFPRGFAVLTLRSGSAAHPRTTTDNNFTSYAGYTSYILLYSINHPAAHFQKHMDKNNVGCFLLFQTKLNARVQFTGCVIMYHTKPIRKPHITHVTYTL